MADDPFSDPELQRLVRSALEMRDQGLEPCLDVICRERPDLLETLETALSISDQLPGLRRRAALRDGFAGLVFGRRYRLGTRLGAGAMGVVYVAEDQELHRSVAVKILRSEFLDELESESRFHREAEVLAAIHHRSVVTVYDRGRTSEDDPYIVMELLEGQPLSRLLDSGNHLAGGYAAGTKWLARELGIESLDESSYIRVVVSWAADLANGLEAAHQKGVFHRDVKPSNVFITRECRPVLLDFGIAAQASQATITRDGAPLGTPAYMAPEALGLGTKPSEALDVYGLAATLYHMLTMSSPYTGSPTQILARLATRDPVPARTVRPGLPKDLQAVLDCGMARRASARYASAAEFEADLRAFLDYRPVRARLVSPARRAWHRLRRSHAFVAAASVACLTILVAVGLWGRTAWLAERRQQHLAVWRRIPANLTLVSQETRVLSERGGRFEVEELLNSAAGVCVDVLPTYLVRAAFRFDHGNRKGAVQDMRRIADSVGTDYARGLAELYASAPEGSTAIDCSVLGDPEEKLDVYLAAFHALRAGGGAKALLGDRRLADYTPARSLQLIYLKNYPQRLFEDALSLEEAIGTRTATTAFYLGSSMLVKQQYERAAEFFEEGLELAPYSVRMRVAAARAAEQLGFDDKARKYLELAIEYHPDYWRSYERLAGLLTNMEELDAALAVLESVPTTLEWSRGIKPHILRGEIGAVRAIRLFKQGQVEASLRSAQDAMGHFQVAQGFPEYTENPRYSICRALAGGEPEAVPAAMADLIVTDPLHWRRLNIFLDWTAMYPNPGDGQQFRKVLKAISSGVAERGLNDSIETRR